MNPLYVSDLDGTLLNSSAILSDKTARILSSLVERGMLFTYATARSYITASRLTKALAVSVPAIVYNGTFIVDSLTGEIMIKNTFENDAHAILTDLISKDIYPIVYSIINGQEKFSYFQEKTTEETARFLISRAGDIRDRPVFDVQSLFEGDIFYFTCIGKSHALLPFYEKYKSNFNTVFHADIYTKDIWLEIMPKNASKANAAKKLKEMLKADRIISFGDGLNDLDLFRVSDECYAVENAHQDLKDAATAVIGRNDDDSVAVWLEAHA